MDVKVGNQIEVPSNKVDAPPRRGQVTEVIAKDPPELRVAWDDGHESVIFPHGGTVHVIEGDATRD